MTTNANNNTNTNTNKPPVVIGVYASGWCDSAPRYNEWGIFIPEWGDVETETRSFHEWNDGAGVVTRTTRPGWVEKEIRIPRAGCATRTLSDLCLTAQVPRGSVVRVEWWAGEYREGIDANLPPSPCGGKNLYIY